MDVYEDKKTQSLSHARSNGSAVAFYEEDAYWIENHTLYRAKHEHGIVDVNTREVVDTINANDVELKAITYIVEKLTEGGHDDRNNPGNKKL